MISKTSAHTTHGRNLCSVLGNLNSFWNASSDWNQKYFRNASWRKFPSRVRCVSADLDGISAVLAQKHLRNPPRTLRNRLKTSRNPVKHSKEHYSRADAACSRNRALQGGSWRRKRWNRRRRMRAVRILVILFNVSNLNRWKSVFEEGQAPRFQLVWSTLCPSLKGQFSRDLGDF